MARRRRDRERDATPPGDAPRRVKLLDANFANQPGSSRFIAPRRLVWDREEATSERGTVVVTDKWLGRDCRARHRIAWLVESPAVHPRIYDRPDRYYRRFERVITCKRSLLERGGKFRLGLFGSCHLRLEDIGVWSKAKNVSMIASTKEKTPGHQIRCEIADAHAGAFDLFGKGRDAELEFKIDGLREYRFSISIENAFVDFYFSEKLIDCFLTGTVPIYMGPPSIGRWFDTRGMILVDGPAQVADALAKATPDAYEAMLPAVRRNFELAHRYVVPEDGFVDDGLI